MPNEIEDMEVGDSPTVDELVRMGEPYAEVDIAPGEDTMDKSVITGVLQPMLSPVHSLGEAQSDVISPASIAPAPFGGPQPIEILFSFDTTGSMSSCLEEVQNNLKTIINRLLMDIPYLKIAIIAHGDYCDAEHFYVTKTLDFTNDVNCLFEFVTNCGGTGGGDYEECYELVMRKVREDFTWTPGTTKSMVMIGDAVPHPPGHGGNVANLDWREEADALYYQLGARVYAIQCLSVQNKLATPFWEDLANRTFGKHLQLDQLESIVELMMAICYREGGNPDMFLAYEREIRAREGVGMHRDLDRMFNTLRSAATPSGPVPTTTRTTHRTSNKPTARKSPKKEVSALLRNQRVLHGFKRANSLFPRPQQLKVTILKKKHNAQKKQMNAKYVHKKQRRENIISQHFVLNDLKWSPWKMYVDESSHVNHKLFTHEQSKKSIYEVAVQPKFHSKNYVVMFRSTQGIPVGVNWDTYIMRGKLVRAQFNSAVSEGCNILVRRAVLPRVYSHEGVKYTSHRQVATLLRRRYNYAWTTSARRCNTGREVVRRGKILSRELISTNLN